MNTKFLVAVIVALLFARTASATAISVSGPLVAAPGGFFDVDVTAQDLFAGRDPSTDGIFGFGFDVTTGGPSSVLFIGADAGPSFEPAISLPEADVFSQALGFGLFPPIAEPLLLATLHFRATGGDLATVSITSDLTNFFQGLQYFNQPFQVPIQGTVSVAIPTIPMIPTPEPGTLLLFGFGLVTIGIVQRGRSRPFSQGSGNTEPGKVSRCECLEQHNQKRNTPLSSRIRGDRMAVGSP